MKRSGITIPERAGATCALGSSGDRLCLAWTGTDTRLNLLWSRDMPVRDGWRFGGKQTLDHRSSSTQSNGQTSSTVPLPPALAATSAGLYLAWTGTDGQLNVMGLEGSGVHHVIPDQRSQRGPALAARGDELALAWTGTDRRLNVIRGHIDGRFGPPVTFEHTTSHAPALCFASRDLILLWTGTDKRLNLGFLRDDQPLQPLTLPEHSTREPAAVFTGDELIVAWRHGSEEVHLHALTNDLVPQRGLVLPTPTMGLTHHGAALAVHDRVVVATVGARRNINIAYSDF